MLDMQFLYFPQYVERKGPSFLSTEHWPEINGTQEGYHTLGIHFQQHCSTTAAHTDPKTSTSSHTSLSPLFHFIRTTTRHPVIQGSCPPESFLMHVQLRLDSQNQTQTPVLQREPVEIQKLHLHLPGYNRHFTGLESRPLRGPGGWSPPTSPPFLPPLTSPTHQKSFVEAIEPPNSPPIRFQESRGLSV